LQENILLLKHHFHLGVFQNSKKFWAERIGIEKEKFYETGKLSKFNTKDYGDLRSILDNTLIATLFRYIMKEIELDSKVRNLVALNGILAAEGGAQIDKGGLHKITISFSQKEKEMFKRLLTNSGLNNIRIEQNSRFCGGSWEEKYFFIKQFLDAGLTPFDKNIERKYVLIKGFLGHRYTKTLKKYLSAIEGEKLKKRELARKLDHRKDSVNEILNKRRYKSFITMDNEKRIITNLEGEEFLKSIRELERQLEASGKEYKVYEDTIKQFEEDLKRNEQSFAV